LTIGTTTIGYSKYGMEYQFRDVESTLRVERRSSHTLRTCSLTGYGVRFRTPGIEATIVILQTFPENFPSNGTRLDASAQWYGGCTAHGACVTVNRDRMRDVMR
jgi:hypothetical protein